MKPNFKIAAIEEDFEYLFDMNVNELNAIGAQSMLVKSKPGYPCRLSLKDAEIDEEVILLSYKHHNVKTAYQATGPIFIRKNAKKATFEINEIPLMLRHRLLSLRIYDSQGMMINAHTLEGMELRENIANIFANNNARYIHVHNAGPGCYNCQINRVE